MTRKKDAEFSAFGRTEKQRFDDAYKAFMAKRGIVPVFKKKRIVPVKRARDNGK